MALAGVYLTKIGVITGEVRKGLSKISLNVTIPCLLFYSNVVGMNVKILRMAWPLALLPCVYVPLGLLMGKLVVLIGQPPSHFRRSAMAAVAFGNSTGMPVVLLQTVRTSIGSAFQLSKTDPMIFLSIYLTSYPLLQWTIGSHLMGTNARSTRPAVTLPAEENDPPTLPLLQLDKYAQFSKTDHTVDTDTATTSRSEISSTRRCLASVATVLSNALVPPVTATLLGVVVGVTPLRGLLIGQDAALNWFASAIEGIGEAAVPVNLFVLGSSLCRRGVLGALPVRLYVLVVLAKMVLMPVMGIIVTMMMRHWVIICEPMDDMFWLVAMLVACTPTANNIVVMAELGGESSEGIAACILVQYLCAPILVTLSLMICVHCASGWDIKYVYPVPIC
eukprot:NODE_8753_length_1472_cov_8.568773.p1 GENE.NODE_8753_length_1472_cov_8.568773~~NODE_8753_length_1472_cov_8.568773.p1  ORF type:complete len:457 (-),score=88.77 NODE_8753_length_1472_cov_8.568773:102-1274(-)